MARAKFRTPAARDAARATIAKMTLAGHAQSEIAQAIGCSQPAVSGHQRALAQQWRAEAAQDMSEHRARCLAELTAVREQAWRAWFDSLEGGRADAGMLRAITTACVEVLKVTGAHEPAPVTTAHAIWAVPAELPLDQWVQEAQRWVSGTSS